MKLYQIGKFASKLGVTHDLLKHYEKYGIIESVRQGDGGYRYYSYTQAPNILSSKEMQNWGLSLREISELLKNADAAGYCDCLSKHIRQMEQEQTLRHRCLDRARRLFKYASQVEAESFAGSWSVEEQEPAWYLPHSTGTDFELVNIREEVLSAWIDYLSITSIATRIYRQTPESPFNCLSHGFLISQEDAKHFQIPLTDSLLPVPAQKCLIYNSAHPTGSRHLKEVITAVLKPPLELIQKHRFTVSGDIYAKTLFKAQYKGREYIYRILYIPLKF